MLYIICTPKHVGGIRESIDTSLVFKMEEAFCVLKLFYHRRRFRFVGSGIGTQGWAGSNYAIPLCGWYFTAFKCQHRQRALAVTGIGKVLIQQPFSNDCVDEVSLFIFVHPNMKLVTLVDVWVPFSSRFIYVYSLNVCRFRIRQLLFKITST